MTVPAKTVSGVRFGPTHSFHLVESDMRLLDPREHGIDTSMWLTDDFVDLAIS